MTEVRRLLAIVLAMALGVGAVACGSDSDSDQNSGANSSQAAGEIEGATWELMNIASGEAASSLPNTVDAPTLEFEDGMVNVFSGCNTGSGEAEIGESTIDFGPIALTKKGCPGLAEEIEGYVTQVIQGEVDYQINQGNLVLEGKQFSLIFTPA